MYILKLLIVDDEFGMRRGAARCLKDFTCRFTDAGEQSQVEAALENAAHELIGFEINEAEDGQEALRFMEKNSYDIILLDYKLPDISGLDMLNILKEKNNRAFIIMMTAYASIDVAVSATKHGAFDFLSKPFSTDELRSAVQKAAAALVRQRKAGSLEEERRRVRFEFLSVLAHELKAPINAVENYLVLIEEQALGGDIKSYIPMIRKCINRIEGMRKLIFDLLDLTRIESGQKIRSLSQVNIIESVQRSIETISAQAAEKNIKITLHSEKEVVINADLSEIEIMFNNLISNAVKYNKHDGSVDIDIKKMDNQLHIKVSDTGIGIKKEDQNRLFKDFVRVKTEKTRDIDGSGLGLSILKKLVAMYDGEISMESELGEGTTFTIHLKKI